MKVWIAALAFWISAAGLAFTYAGYPLLMALLARCARRRVVNPDPAEWPLVSVVLVARNEGSRIRARLQNLAASDYPRMEFVIVSDGSTDHTADEVANFGDPRARLIVQTVAQGKASGLNAGVAAARGEIVVFADARQTFAANTIRDLVRALHAPNTDAASGELEIAPSAEGIGQGIDAYWRLERFLRKAEAEVDSCIGCTGAVYAIRRSAYTPIPADTLLDDVVIPMQIAMRGARVEFCPKAKAFDPQKLAPEIEERRKRRTLAGNFQMLFRYPAWLLPWRNRLWWQLIAHKYLRIVAPVLLIAAFVANFFLLGHPFYQFTAALQVGFYLCAALGRRIPSKPFNIAAGFVFLNVSVAHAFWDFINRRHVGGWDAARKSQP